MTPPVVRRGMSNQARPVVWGWVTHPEHAPVFLHGPHWVYRNESAGD